MVNSERISGTDTFILYAPETTYGTAGTTATIFGGLITSANFEGDRNINERTGFAGTNAYDGRATAQMLPGVVSTKGSVEFDAQRFDWIQYLLLGGRTGNGTVAVPYVYSTGSTSQSVTLFEEIDNVTTDSHRVYPGMIINTANIRCSVGQPVTVSLDLIGGKLSKTTTIGSRQAQLTDEVYNFSGGTIEMPTSTPIGNVIDSVDISWNNNATILHGFNQEAQNARPGKISCSVKFTTKYLDDDQMDKLMGSSTAVTSQTPTTITLKFTRASGQYAYFAFTGVVISRISDGHQLNEFMIEDVENLARYLTVTEAQS